MTYGAIPLPVTLSTLELGDRYKIDQGSLETASSSMSNFTQWAFLSSIKRVARIPIEEVVSKARQRGRIVGVRMAPTEDDDAEPWKTHPHADKPSPALLVRCQSFWN